MPVANERQPTTISATAKQIFQAIAEVPVSRKENGLPPLPFGTIEIDQFEEVARIRKTSDYLQGTAGFEYREEITVTAGANDQIRVDTTLIAPFNPNPFKHPSHVDDSFAASRIQSILSELQRAA